MPRFWLKLMQRGRGGSEQLERQMARVKMVSVGVPWYRKSDYERVRALMVDASRLPVSYGTWRCAALELVERIRRDGRRAVRVQLDPDVFIRWCVANELDLNANARTMFAAEGARRIQEKI